MGRIQSSAFFLDVITVQLPDFVNDLAHGLLSLLEVEILPFF